MGFDLRIAGGDASAATRTGSIGWGCDLQPWRWAARWFHLALRGDVLVSPGLRLQLRGLMAPTPSASHDPTRRLKRTYPAGFDGDQACNEARCGWTRRLIPPRRCSPWSVCPGLDGRSLGLTAGKLTSHVLCSEAAARGRVIPTLKRQSSPRSRREAAVIIEAWRRHYNAVRPHSSLNYMTPHEFKHHNPVQPNRAVLQE